MSKRLFLCLILAMLVTGFTWAEKRIDILEPTAVLISEDAISFAPTGDRQIDTLYYDSGSTTSGYYWAANYVMAMRMTPAGPCKILGGIFYSWSRSGTPTFLADIFDWTGSAPGSQLGTGVSVPTTTSATWRYADFSPQDINVTGDFLVGFHMQDDLTVIGYEVPNSGRCWDRTPGGSWSSWNETYFIRAVVEYTAADTNDVGPVSIDIPSDVPWNTIIPPQATVKNFGNVMETFDVTCEIDPGGYSSTETVTDLAAGDSIQVTFTPDFTFAMEDTYTVTVYTQLSGDMDTSNDTMVALIATYDPGIAEEGSLPEVFSSSVSSISKGLVTIQFALPTATRVELTVYDVLGRERETLVSDTYSAGFHRVDAQLDVPSGVYFYRMETGLSIDTNGKIILVD